MAIRVTAVLFMMGALRVAATAQPPDAAQVVADYLRMPHPEGSGPDEARPARLGVLAGLQAAPDDAADAIGTALPKVRDARRRAELAETLGRHIQTEASAKLLCGLLKDPDAQVRWQAIHGLRMLSRRTNRMGPQRTAARSQVGPGDERATPPPEFPPKVEGLVPHLVAAADDEAENNRICALYALADSRDAAAVAELRKRLGDPSEKVRFHAACFLTEYQDASGLPEMQAALARLLRSDPNEDVEYYFHAAALLASFERITGKSFGPLPLNPLLSSDTEEMPRLERRYNALLTTWARWWAWEPPADP